MEKRCFYLTLILFISILPARAQDGGFVKGTVSDNKVLIPLKNSSVNLLRAKDSTLYLSVRADKDGRFVFNRPVDGDYILLVTYRGYADYVHRLSVNEKHRRIDLGEIGMLLKARLLNEVVIVGSRAVTLKGDTIQYDARSYVIEPNSKVEDLLTQLPGIQVDQNGKITAQGKEVKKVLVDGEEFFSDDPTLVTRNLRGDMIDKVQVYDEKSETAKFTGIEDGVRDKTVNLKLREDSKKGYFGNAEASKATNPFYLGKGMVNYFSKEAKVAAFGGLSNYRSAGSGYTGGSRNFVLSGDGEMSFNFLGQGEPQQRGGIPVSREAGLHYDGTAGAELEGVNVDYFFKSVSNEGKSNSIVRNNLRSGIQNTYSDQDFDSRKLSHSLKGGLQLTFDSTSRITGNINANYADANNISKYNTVIRDEDSLMLNNSSRVLDTKGRGAGVRGNMQLFKRLAKHRRTLVAELGFDLSETNNEGRLYSEDTFYRATGDSSGITDQYKSYLLTGRGIHTRWTYTEPLGKKLTFDLTYKFDLNIRRSSRLSYNASSPGEYSQLDSSFSSRYHFRSMSNSMGTSLNYKFGHAFFDAGIDVQSTGFKQTDLFRGGLFERDFLLFNPSASFSGKVNNGNFQVFYRGSRTLPQIEQLQPVRENTNPLYEVLGNTSLRPSFNHTISANYMAVRKMGRQNLNVSALYSLVESPIVQNSVTDTLGKTTLFSSNLNDRNLSTFSTSAGGTVTLKNKMTVSVRLSLDNTVSYNLTNGAESKIIDRRYSTSVSLNHYLPKKVRLMFNVVPSYTINTSSLQAGINNNGFVMNSNCFLMFYLPFKFDITNTVNQVYNAATQYFREDFSQTTWNVSVGRSFSKQNLKLTASMNDVLNQNSGFSRSMKNNLTVQNNYSTVRRYVLFSLIYDFKKMGPAGSE
ncbi:outer membrane beta-barrel protein [Arcticibacter tournemirensis]|uniref:Outer membrane protein beta-barrel domain-containing protein n=1 Tax=Arcticibacter tournemirensis TaxID=699437 RepID=A0A4Q0M885_9SPHI|nr:outer membrane beta-barrel protein [Arcticibacter tournemirensis]RXF69341.1 hypothetical protein EKH83_11680 [Arcticibacter tournemirensis]